MQHHKGGKLTELSPTQYNRRAWDHLVAQRNRWTIPFVEEQIEAARRGACEIVLTPTRIVPQPWLGDLPGQRVLCLAGGGGQQSALLAAAGAQVVVLDNSPRQLQQDLYQARRHQLPIEVVLGDMQCPDMLADATFDLIVHPCSNVFVPDVRSVWRGAFRVLRPGGRLLAGFVNPLRYLFPPEVETEADLQVLYSIPHCDRTNLRPEHLQPLLDRQEPLEYGHSLEDQLGGQTAAGFELLDLFEDRYGAADPISDKIASFMATLARKPHRAG